MDLLDYFNNRLEKPHEKPLNKKPFITISRESGCDASRLARILIERFHEINQHWRYIDKEILTETSRELQMDKSKIDYVFNAEKKKHADEILSALSNRYYKSDFRVRKAIANVVSHIAGEGQVILVGRGGAAITSGMRKGIHIKLVAPLEWRVNNLMKRKGRSRIEVLNYITDSDRKRQILLQDFKRKSDDQLAFDLIINCSKFVQLAQSNIIIEAMKGMGLISNITVGREIYRVSQKLYL